MVFSDLCALNMLSHSLRLKIMHDILDYFIRTISYIFKSSDDIDGVRKYLMTEYHHPEGYVKEMNYDDMLLALKNYNSSITK